MKRKIPFIKVKYADLITKENALTGMNAIIFTNANINFIKKLMINSSKIKLKYGRKNKNKKK
jgi:hypothetical protein